MTATRPRGVTDIHQAARTLEGGGFPVRRPFPTRRLADADPFLLLDEMGPVEWAPGEAVGAPEHPHRGFETVTYLLAGEMEHADSGGHHGLLGPGDVQWMTAGRGLVHSELPSARFQQRGGLMHGFQLWVNLPARDKMVEPGYQEIPAAQIPTARTADGLVEVRVIAGESLGERAVIATRTPIVFLHVKLQPGGGFEQALPADHRAIVYVLRGEVRLGPERVLVLANHVARLSDGGPVVLEHGAGEPAEVLLLAGVPLDEPVARYGPFVMNTEAEIEQAIRDHRAGLMGRLQPEDKAANG